MEITAELGVEFKPVDCTNPEALLANVTAHVQIPGCILTNHLLHQANLKPRYNCELFLTGLLLPLFIQR